MLELFQEDLARFHVLLGAPLGEDSLVALRARQAAGSAGVAQSIAARSIDGTGHASDALEGKAHLRIENRVLPSGPTVLDEVSNAAFFVGLMSGGLAALGDISKKMAFSDAEANFLAAAQTGSMPALPGLKDARFPLAI